MSPLEQKIMEMIALLPEWARNGQLKLFSEQELVWKHNEVEGLKVKSVRCNRCGECCLDIPEGHTPFGVDDEGKCKALNKDMTCNAGYNKPFRCMDDPAEQSFEELGCCIRYD